MPDIDRSQHNTNYWLVKTEPNEFSFEDLVRDGRTVWDGVRNYQARNNLRLMRPGDLTLIYHSIGPKTVVGIARIISDPYPDPTDNPKGMWTVVDMVPVKPFTHPVTLEVMKNTPELVDLPLIRQSRLSVMPLSRSFFEHLLQLGQTVL
jgi:predicted RNA-binding protein with PUA-like domain